MNQLASRKNRTLLMTRFFLAPLGLKFQEPGGGRNVNHQHIGREAEVKGEIYLNKF